MVKLSEVYREMGIAFAFPIAIKDEAGHVTYCETSNGWLRREYDSDGNRTYYEIHDGYKTEAPQASNPCDGKIIEIEGVKYQLKSL